MGAYLDTKIMSAAYPCDRDQKAGSRRDEEERTNPVDTLEFHPKRRSGVINAEKQGYRDKGNANKTIICQFRGLHIKRSAGVKDKES
jgi:hypothetical protein